MAVTVPEVDANPPTVASATVAKSFVTTPSVGDSIVVIVESADATVLALTCADNQVGGTNVYTNEGTVDVSRKGSDNINIRVTLFRCKVVNVASGTFTVTVSGGTVATFWNLGIMRVAGLGTGAIDTQATNGATASTNPASVPVGPTGVPTQGDALSVVAMTYDGFGTATGIVMPAGYTSITLQNNGVTNLTGAIGYKILSGVPATQSVSFGTAINPSGGPGSWSAFIAIFDGLGGVITVQPQQMTMGVGN